MSASEFLGSELGVGSAQWVFGQAPASQASLGPGTLQAKLQSVSKIIFELDRFFAS